MGVHCGRVGKMVRRSNERDLGATRSGHRGNGVSLLPGGAIPEISHRIEFFQRPAGGDENGKTEHVLRQRARVIEKKLTETPYLFGLGQSTCTRVRARQSAGRRGHHRGAVAPQGRNIPSRGGVLPHFGVHRGCVENRARGGK